MVLRQLICRAEDLTTTEVADLAKDCSNKAIVVSRGFSVEVSKASLFKKQNGSADFEIIGESCVIVPSLSYLLIDARQGVHVSASVVSIVSERKITNLGPPAGVRSRDFDISVF